MNSLSYYPTMARYNQWMNQKLYTLCAELPDELRKQDRGAFFRSIHSTLNHILYGDRVWLGRFTQTPYQGPPLGQDLYDSFSELHQAREAMDHTLLEWAKTLTPDWLGSSLTYTSSLDQQTRVLPAWLLVTHLFNHQIHHRGQVTTLLSQLGIDPGITDLPWLPVNPS